MEERTCLVSTRPGLYVMQGTLWAPEINQFLSDGTSSASVECSCDRAPRPEHWKLLCRMLVTGLLTYASAPLNLYWDAISEGNIWGTDS